MFWQRDAVLPVARRRRRASQTTEFPFPGLRVQKSAWPQNVDVDQCTFAFVRKLSCLKSRRVCLCPERCECLLMGIKRNFPSSRSIRFAVYVDPRRFRDSIRLAAKPKTLRSTYSYSGIGLVRNNVFEQSNKALLWQRLKWTITAAIRRVFFKILSGNSYVRKIFESGKYWPFVEGCKWWFQCLLTRMSTHKIFSSLHIFAIAPAI